MKYRTLTGTGISVSNLALGTMGFGSETAENDAFEILDRSSATGDSRNRSRNVLGWSVGLQPQSPLSAWT